LRFLIRIAFALLTALAKKRSIGPHARFQNSTSYTTDNEYQGGLCRKFHASRLQEMALRICSAHRQSRHRLDLSVPPVFLV
jgi:hypothetical protein